MAWNINFAVIKKSREIGRKCVCDISKPCICDTFIDTGVCKCGAFREVKE